MTNVRCTFQVTSGAPVNRSSCLQKWQATHKVLGPGMVFGNFEVHHVPDISFLVICASWPGTGRVQTLQAASSKSMCTAVSS